MVAHAGSKRFPSLELTKGLRKYLLLVYCCILGNPVVAVHVQYDHAELSRLGRERSLRILKKALAKASEYESPEALFAQIANATIAVHTPDDSLDMIDRLADGLEKWEENGATWPRSDVNAFAAFAQCVAPFSSEKRDNYLKRALLRSVQQSPTDEFLPKMLQLERQLWSAILLSREYPAQAEDQLRRLWHEVKHMGEFGDSHPRSWKEEVRSRLTRLNPALMLKVCAEDNIEHYCLRHGQELHEHIYGRANRFSEILIKHAVEHGRPSVKLLHLYKFYDVEDAYRRASKLPANYLVGVFDRGYATSDVLGYWAWMDPAKALHLAEQETDPDTLRDAIQAVSTTWAYLRPEQIERAIRKQDNEVRKSWARQIAAEEQERRKEGKPQTDSLAAFCTNDSPRTLTRDRFACSTAEREKRVASLLEVIETSDDNTLYELTCVFVYDKQLGMKMLQPNKYYRTRQAYLIQIIENLGYGGDHELAEELLGEVEGTPEYVKTACSLAKNTVKRIYVLHGPGAPHTRKRATPDEGFGNR